MGRMNEVDRRPGWLRPGPGEHRWPVAVAILIAIALQVLTPAGPVFDPRWLLPGIELALLVGLTVANPFRLNTESRRIRTAALALVLVASLAVVWSTGRLVVTLFSAGRDGQPALLL